MGSKKEAGDQFQVLPRIRGVGVIAYVTYLKYASLDNT